MSEQKKTVEKKVAHKPRPKKTSSGGGGAFLAMAIALAAAGGSYYVWQQHLIAQQGRQALEQNIERLLDAVEKRDKAQLARIEQLTRHRHNQTEQRLETLEQAQALPNLNQQLTPQQLDWSLAEVDYLLRLAEHRLQISRDIPTAVTALSQARDQLVGHSNGNFANIVAKIEENIRFLASIEQGGIEQISARLGKLLATVDSLTFAVHSEPEEKPQQRPTPVAEDAKLTTRIQYWGQVVWHDIMSLVTIRRSDEISRPQASPEQRYIIQAQLRLKLETARLAALSRNQALYRASLTEAANWLNRYYDNSDSVVSEDYATLNELAELPINPELPSLLPLRQQLHTQQPLQDASPQPMEQAQEEPAATVITPDAPVTTPQTSPDEIVEEPQTGSPL
ncbi:MAG: uroporphyrinogen-III C-methyltransferase [Pseudomonadota bacterium]